MSNNNQPEKKADTNSWMTTYTDLMILLLTFFVLLLSLSIIDKERKRVALNSLVGAFGFKPGGLSILGKPKGLNITMGSAPLVKEEISFERLRNISLRNGMESNTQMIQERERIILAVQDKVFFKPRSTEIDPNVKPFLREVGEMLKDEDCFIELRGYSAPSEIVFEKDPEKLSLLLSAERAFVVYQFLREKGGIPGKRIVAHGFGTSGTEGSGKSKKGKFNRQVEIILDYHERIPFRLKNPEKKGGFLDFKGFFFRFPGKINEQ
ncbi:MAG: OmpA family protein [Deltaproteobacteria bacterium]|nr:OmpA family protein [Deltaproteobacteria bacterium]